MITHLNHIQSPCNVIQTSLESSSLSLSPIQQPTLQCPIFLSKKQHAFYTHTKQHHLPSTILYDTILTLRAGNYNRNSNNCYADRGGYSNSSTNSKNNSNSSSSSSSSTQDVISTFKNELQRMRLELEEEGKEEIRKLKLTKKKKKEEELNEDGDVKKKEKERNARKRGQGKYDEGEEETEDQTNRVEEVQEDELQDKTKGEDMEVMNEVLELDDENDDDTLVVHVTDESNDDILETLFQEDEVTEEDETEEKSTLQREIYSGSPHEGEEISDIEDMIRESEKDMEPSIEVHDRGLVSSVKENLKADDIKQGKKSKRQEKKIRKSNHKKKKTKDKSENNIDITVLETAEIRQVHEQLTEQLSKKAKDEVHLFNILIKSLIPTFIVILLLIASHFVFESILKTV